MKPWLSLLLVVCLLAACTSPPAVSPATDTAPPAGTATATSTDTPQITASATQESAAEILTLRVWLPPQFDPSYDSPAAVLLQEHLQAFAARRPGLQIDVRLKSLEGPGGMLNSLATASSAAPTSLPDLVLLPYELLAPAVLKGLLKPVTNLDKLNSSSALYPFADELAHLQNSAYGIPMAGDALVLVYRPLEEEAPPADWEALTTTGRQFSFAAAEPNSLFTLALYRASSGQIVDDQGRPVIQESILSRVFTFYRQAELLGQLPPSLVQYASTTQVWQAFLEGRSDMAVVWISQYLRDRPEGVVIAPLPTLDGRPYTLATGFAWAIAAPTPERQELAAQLAEYMADETFLAAWTEASGYLPPKPKVLDAWSLAGRPAALETVALSAHLVPPPEIGASLGLALQKAITQLLSGQSDPDAAARLATQSLISP